MKHNAHLNAQVEKPINDISQPLPNRAWDKSKSKFSGGKTKESDQLESSVT